MIVADLKNKFCFVTTHDERYQGQNAHNLLIHLGFTVNVAIKW